MSFKFVVAKFKRAPTGSGIGVAKKEVDGVASHKHLTMGYYFTTSAENAVLGKFWGMPKTHVPGSPVKERGLRFYNTGVGRWVGRDPIEEEGGLNLAQFVGNDPVGRQDAFGLAECCCCCAEKLAPIVVGNHIIYGPPLYTFMQTLKFEGQLKYVKNQTVWGDCHFTWSEWSDHDIPVGPVPGDKQWHDITGASSTTGCTGAWENRSKKCPGSEPFTFIDFPVVSWGSDAPDAPRPPFRWEHKIRVELISTDGCPSCRCKKIVAEIDRVTTWVGGKKGTLKSGTMMTCVN